MNYKKLKEECKKEPECWCPPEHIVLREIANTPEHLRRYFEHCTEERKDVGGK